MSYQILERPTLIDGAAWRVAGVVVASSPAAAAAAAVRHVRHVLAVAGRFVEAKPVRLAPR
jgi:hypothetical protein